nr:hypothetical protein [Tanacetum cinerariifolium]
MNELKDNVIADDVKIEVDLKPAHPSFRKVTLDNGYLEKLNLDPSSGDDSIEEDVLETKQIDSKFTSQHIGDVNEKTQVPPFKEGEPLDVMANDTHATKNDESAKDTSDYAAVSTKRKLNDNVCLDMAPIPSAVSTDQHIFVIYRLGNVPLGPLQLVYQSNLGNLGKKEVIEELETKLQVPEHPVNLGVPEDKIITPQKQHRKGQQIKPVDGYLGYYFKCKYHKVCQGKANIIEPPNNQAFDIYTFEHSCGGGHGDHVEGASQEVPGEGAGQGVPGEDHINCQYRMRKLCCTMIYGYAHINEVDNALECLRKLKGDGCVMSRFTVTGVLPVLTLKGDVWNGRGVHELMIKMGCFSSVAICNALVDMYGKCKCFSGVANTIIGVHQQSSDHDASFGPDLVTVTTMLPVCSHLVVLRHGKEIHGYMITKGLGIHNSEDRVDDTYINNVVMDMYGKCGSMKKLDWFLAI